MTGLVGRLLGIASTALGLFVLWASPVSTVSCRRVDAGVECRIDRAMLGLLPLEGARVSGILRCSVSSTSPPPDPSRRSDAPPRNDTYQLEFETKGGRVAPRGADDSSRDGLNQIAQQVNELVQAPGDPFSQRSFNTFPNVAGAIFLAVGLIFVLFAR